jgi:RES domain-containing protein
MIPLPGALGGRDLVAWRIDRSIHRDNWDGGEGAYRAGGRWNGKGVRAVYCSLDPATAILEVAVHTGFEVLDRVPHVLTAAEISEPGSVHIVDATDVRDPAWLRPGIPSAGQKEFGGRLLARHKFILVPSVVSTHSWNLVFVAASAAGAYSLRSQESFVLDVRINRPRR